MRFFILTLPLLCLYSQINGQRLEIFELRNYQLKPGHGDQFRNFFDKNFLNQQIEVGVYVFGHFYQKDQPDRFVWFRGFENMKARGKASYSFYGGEAWKNHGAVAVDMMIPKGNLKYLLKPLPDLKNELTNFENRDQLSEAEVVVVHILQAKGLTSDAIAKFIEGKFIDDHKGLLGAFIGDESENSFPIFPIVQDKNIAVVIRSLEDLSQYTPVELKSPIWEIETLILYSE